MRPSHAPLPHGLPRSERLLCPRPGAGDRYNMVPQGICLLGEGRLGLIKQIVAKQCSQCWKRSRDRGLWRLTQSWGSREPSHPWWTSCPCSHNPLLKAKCFMRIVSSAFHHRPVRCVCISPFYRRENRGLNKREASHATHKAAQPRFQPRAA